MVSGRAVAHFQQLSCRNRWPKATLILESMSFLIIIFKNIIIPFFEEYYCIYTDEPHFGWVATKMSSGLSWKFKIFSAWLGKLLSINKPPGSPRTMPTPLLPGKSWLKRLPGDWMPQVFGTRLNLTLHCCCCKVVLLSGWFLRKSLSLDATIIMTLNFK